ncbi:hypothetical protein NTJ28_002594 [Flavobacterium psychrophilum]|nr:hypothetical protein [Flavobacterium psychrophilum]EKT4510912.1 hypothetical protein [Flavobacterium psychrophilum]
MKFLRNKKLLLLLLISICLYIKVYKFDRYFIPSKNNKTHITYLIDGNLVYIIPYKYWGLSNPKTNFIKFDRSNFSEEMNTLTFFNSEKYHTVIEYENGELIENKLSDNCYYFNSSELRKNPYLNEIRFQKNKKNVEITSTYIRSNNPFWNFINKLF